jgi:hypothetical protein
MSYFCISEDSHIASILPAIILPCVVLLICGALLPVFVIMYRRRKRRQFEQRRLEARLMSQNARSSGHPGYYHQQTISDDLTVAPLPFPNLNPPSYNEVISTPYNPATAPPAVLDDPPPYSVFYNCAKPEDLNIEIQRHGIKDPALPSYESVIAENQAGIQNRHSLGQVGIQTTHNPDQVGIQSIQNPCQVGIESIQDPCQAGIQNMHSPGQAGIQNMHSPGQVGIQNIHSSGQVGQSNRQYIRQSSPENQHHPRQSSLENMHSLGQTHLQDFATASPYPSQEPVDPHNRTLEFGNTQPQTPSISYV